MARKTLIRTSKYPYHVWLRSNNQDWFQAGMDEIWEIFVFWMNKTIEKYCIQPLAFVLMMNHFHLLIKTPLSNLDQAMNYFLGQSSKAIGSKTWRINRIFGTRYKWNLITTERYYAHVFKYIYMNPIEKNICKEVENYPWSTLFPHQEISKQFTLFLPKDLEAVLPKDADAFFKWLNKPVSKEFKDNIGKALRKTTFKFPRSNLTKKEMNFDEYLPEN